MYKVAVFKFNGGVGALLCNNCRTIIKEGNEHKDKKHYCKECSNAVVYILDPVPHIR